MANGRCRMHGGPSTGPRTPQGRANSRQARLQHGRYSAPRKRLRRQLTWVRKFVKVLGTVDKMRWSLLDLGEALEMDQPLGELTPKCLRLLPVYTQYLEVVEAASEVGVLARQHRPQPNERRLLAVLWAGSEGAGAQDLHKLLVGESSDARLVISRLLTNWQRRIAELFGLTLEKIREALDAEEIGASKGLESLDRADHQMRLLAVSRFRSLLTVLLKTAKDPTLRARGKAVRVAN